MENNLKHSDLACSIPRLFSFLFGGGANPDGASQCPSTGRCLAPRPIQHCVRSLCAIETLGPCLGGEKIPVGSSQQFLGQDWAVSQQLMLAGLGLTLCSQRSVSVQECPVAAPWCHQSQLLSPLPCQGPAGSGGGSAQPFQLGFIGVCAQQAPPALPPCPSSALSAASEGEIHRGALGLGQQSKISYWWDSFVTVSFLRFGFFVG